jgi:hypothetical protein
MNKPHDELKDKKTPSQVDMTFTFKNKLFGHRIVHEKNTFIAHTLLLMIRCIVFQHQNSDTFQQNKI